jgi:hypothetical protein
VKISTPITSKRRDSWTVKPVEAYWLSRVQDALADLGGRRVTKRQVFYRLVGAYDYPKAHDDPPGFKRAEGDTPAKRLETLIAHACWWGHLDWWLIRDPSRSQSVPMTYSSPDDFIVAAQIWADAYTIDRQTGQDVRLEVRVEANGMLDTVIPVCREYGISCYANGGNSSHTALYEAADRIAKADVTTVVLVVGDLDLQGGHIKDSVEAFLKYHSAGMLHDYVDVAVTPGQVKAYGLPTDPDKGLSVQAEALTPQELEAELRDAIEQWVDDDAREETLARETTEREEARERIASA